MCLLESAEIKVLEHCTWKIDNAFETNKSGPVKICGKQPLKNFTWSILEYFVPFVLSASCLQDLSNFYHSQTLAFDESRGLFTFCKDAFHRIAGIYSSRGHGRLLPLYSLLLPSILYGIMRYTVKSIVTYLINQVQIKRHRMNQRKRDHNLKKQYYTELVSNLYASLLTDMLMFPLETVILRLHIQGTRTIIDDTDKGIGVVPLCTNYDGISDCMSTIRREEGIGGFFKGLGALLLQYFVQGVIVKLAKPLYREA